MDSEVILEDLRVMVQKLMLKKGVSDYDLKIDGQTENGDNYMGVIIFFRVVTRDTERVYNLVMKTGQRSEEFRKTVKPETGYLREIYMYSEIFPAFRKFTAEINPEIELDMIAKLYWECTDNLNETLILENLKCSGYRLHDRKKTWNLEHSLFAMEKYGRFHGISFALRDRKPEIFKRLTENLTSVFTDDTSFDINKIYMDAVENVMHILKNAGRTDLVEKFDGFKDEIRETIFGNADEKDRLVICHGDCWNNNFMFKYQGEDCSKPSKMCFLDIQGSSLDSPAKDLSYNIYTSCDKSSLNQLDLLLETYYDSLSNTIKSLGSNPEELFTYEELQRHWKDYAKFGVILSTLIIKGQLVNADDAPDVAKFLEEGKKVEDAFHFKVDGEEYNQRILEVYIHYGETIL